MEQYEHLDLIANLEADLSPPNIEFARGQSEDPAGREPFEFNGAQLTEFTLGAPLPGDVIVDKEVFLLDDDTRFDFGEHGAGPNSRPVDIEHDLQVNSNNAEDADALDDTSRVAVVAAEPSSTDASHVRVFVPEMTLVPLSEFAGVQRIALLHLLQLGWLLVGDVLECLGIRGVITARGGVKVADAVGKTFDAPSPFLNHCANLKRKGSVNSKRNAWEPPQGCDVCVMSLVWPAGGAFVTLADLRIAFFQKRDLCTIKSGAPASGDANRDVNIDDTQQQPHEHQQQARLVTPARPVTALKPRSSTRIARIKKVKLFDDVDKKSDDKCGDE